jgi:hypothetical protein
VKTAQPFHGNAAAHAQDLPGTMQRIAIKGDAKAVGQLQLWTAGGTGGGFGMKAAAVRALVFAATGRAQQEGQHAGVGAVVGQAVGNGVARAAIGTVDKGVAIAAVAGVEQLGEAGRTGGAVCRQACLGGAAAAAADFKAVFIRQRVQLALLHAVDLRQRWQILLQMLLEGIQLAAAALQLDGDAFAGVEHKAG